MKFVNIWVGLSLCCDKNILGVFETYKSRDG